MLQGKKSVRDKTSHLVFYFTFIPNTILFLILFVFSLIIVTASTNDDHCLDKKDVISGMLYMIVSSDLSVEQDFISLYSVITNYFLTEYNSCLYYFIMWLISTI